MVVALAGASTILLILVARMSGSSASPARRRLRRVLLAAILAAGASGVAGGERAQAAVPAVTPACNGVPGDCTRWWTEPVSLTWQVGPPEADRAGCTPRGFDADGMYEQTCTASLSSPPTSAAVTVTIRVDRTPPGGLGATLARPPDHSGWYTSPVAVSFTGTDETSGVEECTSVVYAGPDSGSASVVGGCRDRAGNRSAPLAVALRYDASPPSLGSPSAQPGDGFAVIDWRAASDATVTVVRTPGLRRAGGSVVFRGRAGRFVDKRVRNGRAYLYRVSAVDPAGNSTTRTVRTRPGRRLLRPARGARVSRPPLLTWTAAPGARYYNVQLRRAGRKILTAWPRRPRLALRRGWRFAGARQRLTPGVYRWDVWPGLGAQRAGRYGARIGTRTFVVRRPVSPGSTPLGLTALGD